MITIVGRCLLFFFAGICFHMSILHFYGFSETASHPMIRMWKYPKLASSIWGSIQLAVGLIVVFLLKYQLQQTLDTLFLFIGFAVWGIFRAVILEKKEKNKSAI
ncbi:MAG TPA: hypothetical protein VMC09_03200 [Anaerolineales bacterium]|nr:hypothetical protein [Anaerolineales bacterium]